MDNFKKQLGFSQILLTFLLLGGVALGTYLVQNRTNIFPKAAETLSTYKCGEAARDKNIIDKTPSGFKWHAFCSLDDYKDRRIPCTNNSDCPINDVDVPDSSTNTPARFDPKKSSWCYAFKDGNRCLQLRVKSAKDDDQAYSTPKQASQATDTTCVPSVGTPCGDPKFEIQDKLDHYLDNLDDYRQKFDKFKDSKIPKVSEVAKKGIGMVGPKEGEGLTKRGKECLRGIESGKEKLNEKGTFACYIAFKADYVRIKTASRLIDYFRVISATKTKDNEKDLCVSADLGIYKPNDSFDKLFGKVIYNTKPSPRAVRPEYARLYLCVGNKEHDLKWRAIDNPDNVVLRLVQDGVAFRKDDDGKFKETTIKLSAATAKELDGDYVKAIKKYVEKAIERVGVKS